jgi:hypothetical protein
VLTVTANIKDAALAPYLEKRAALHQKVLRKLFVAIYIKQEDPNQAYNRLAAEYGIFAVEINSIRKETEAIYSSWKELLTLRVTEQQGKIDRLDKKLNQPRKKPLNPSKVHQWKRKLHRYRTKLEALKAELTAGIPRICFGSKTLFYRQFNLEKNGYQSHADWRAHWVEGRSHTFYLAGRGNERSGNDACMMEVMDVSNGALTCVLKLRKKNDEIPGVRAKAGDYIQFPVKFTYNSHYVLRALEEKRPITYRFIREGEHWKVQATVALPAAPIITSSKNGSLGLDQNPLCILAAGIKPDGNEDGSMLSVRWWTWRWPLAGQSSLNGSISSRSNENSRPADSTACSPASSTPCFTSCFMPGRPSLASRSSRLTRLTLPFLAGSNSVMGTGSTDMKPPPSPSGAGSSGPMANHFLSESACGKHRGTRPHADSLKSPPPNL